MRSRVIVATARSVVLLSALALIFADRAAAFVFDASVKEVYEDNINLLLSGPVRPATDSDAVFDRLLGTGTQISGERLGDTARAASGKSDFYTVLSGAIAKTATVGVEAELAVKAEITRYQFEKFKELDVTSAGLHAAACKQFSDTLSSQFALFVRFNDYQDNDRDGKSYGEKAGMKQQFSRKFWLNEDIGYEKIDANSVFFGYRGPFLKAGMGYLISSSFLVTAEYAYTLRKFDSGSKTKIHSSSINGTWQITKAVSFMASFEHQSYISSFARSRDTDNISAAGISFTY